jgi:glycosyltransferase involved in cell wall biosynthesis
MSDPAPSPAQTSPQAGARVPRLRILFIHQNFPGQFKFLAPALAAQGHEVVAMTMQATQARVWQGIRIHPYRAARGTTPGVHPWVGDFETKTIRGEACFRAALEMRAQGFTPDVVVAHPGWGESLFVKDVWHVARLGVYSEFFYRAEGADTGFDPEFSASDPGDVCRLRLKNLNNLLHFEIADGAISPTRWQASTFPEPFRSRIRVIHDGIDTAAVTPEPGVRIALRDGGALTRADEIVTFVNRNLEPYRGYHVFMRALPELLASRPRARVLIVGGDGVSYGARSPDGRRWRDIFIDEVRPRIPDADWARVHLLGNLPYEHFLALLRVSTVHVYLTYPFVLSWSLLEAMSAGCAIVASDTAPLREAIAHDQTGRLVGFFDGSALVRSVCDLLEHPGERARLGAAARAFAQQTYDLRSVCLPAQLRWVAELAGGGA